MTTMLAAILAALLTSRGTPATSYGNLVAIEGRPGCTAQALYGDPTRPVVVCQSVPQVSP